MRVIATTILAGVGSLVLAGSVAAQGLPAHTITIQLPNDTIEEIHYSGNIAPRVEFLPAPIPASVGDSRFWAFAPGSPYATMEQIAAEMDRDAAAMLQQALSLTAQPMPRLVPLVTVNAGDLPRGAQAYSFVANFSDNGVCTRSMEIVSGGPGVPPRVIAHSSGSCGATPSVIGTPRELPDAVPTQNAPQGLPVRYRQPKPSSGWVRAVAWQGNG